MTEQVCSATSWAGAIGFASIPLSIVIFCGLLFHYTVKEKVQMAKLGLSVEGQPLNKGSSL